MQPTSRIEYAEVYDWSNLLSAWRKASKGKRRGNNVAQFEFDLARHLLELQNELRNKTYCPGEYHHFVLHEAKRRLISAAPFRDRIVHHALCNVIEPIFEESFIADSYANRQGRGTHKAIARLQQFCQRYEYVLRLDIIQHFPSMDHQILLQILQKHITDPDVLWLISVILASGADIPGQSASTHFFPEDDLLSLTRPRGLPIGNLTSQFWSNCYLHPLDQFIKRELSVKGYLRYVDDFALFSNSKAQLWEWKQTIRDKLSTLRLRFHEGAAQVQPTTQGVPWLGMIVFPDHRRLKRRKVVHASRRLRRHYQEWQTGQVSFAELDASVQGWIAHAQHADSWGLRRHVFNEIANG